MSRITRARFYPRGFFLQFFSLITPLFFYVVIDKVQVHRGLFIFDVPVMGLVVGIAVRKLVDGAAHPCFRRCHQSHRCGARDPSQRMQRDHERVTKGLNT